MVCPVSQPSGLHLRRRSEPKFAYTAFSTVAYGLRSYSPELGRWINRDPIGELGGENRYSFIGNNALSNVEFIGLIPWQTPSEAGLDILITFLPTCGGVGAGTAVGLCLPFLAPSLGDGMYYGNFEFGLQYEFELGTLHSRYLFWNSASPVGTEHNGESCYERGAIDLYTYVDKLSTYTDDWELEVLEEAGKTFTLSSGLFYWDEVDVTQYISYRNNWADQAQTELEDFFSETVVRRKYASLRTVYYSCGCDENENDTWQVIGMDSTFVPIKEDYYDGTVEILSVW